jgi:dihydropteroate synthase
MARATAWKLRDRDLDLGQPIAAAIVNVTTDSMFAGARSGTPEGAIADGAALAEAGFEMLDVGAVAARSGPAVAAEEESAALVPAIEGLLDCGLPISTDTFSPRVAREALEAGAVAINDIGGGSAEMYDVLAGYSCGYVLMHIEGPPRVERPIPRRGDPVEHLKRWFASRIETALSHGVREEQIAIDPGFDFDLTTEESLAVLRRLEELHDLGRPLYVSLSRKDFIGAAQAGSWERRAAAEDREWGTAAAAALAVAAGAQILRLHDRSALQAVRVAGRIATAAA